MSYKKCFSFWGLRPADPLPELRPWSPLGLPLPKPSNLVVLHGPVPNEQSKKNSLRKRKKNADVEFANLLGRVPGRLQCILNRSINVMY